MRSLRLLVLCLLLTLVGAAPASANWDGPGNPVFVYKQCDSPRGDATDSVTGFYRSTGGADFDGNGITDNAMFSAGIHNGCPSANGGVRHRFDDSGTMRGGGLHVTTCRTSGTCFTKVSPAQAAGWTGQVNSDRDAWGEIALGAGENGNYIHQVEQVYSHYTEIPAGCGGCTRHAWQTMIWASWGDTPSPTTQRYIDHCTNTSNIGCGSSTGGCSLTAQATPGTAGEFTCSWNNGQLSGDDANRKTKRLYYGMFCKPDMTVFTTCSNTYALNKEYQARVNLRYNAFHIYDTADPTAAGLGGELFGGAWMSAYTGNGANRSGTYNVADNAGVAISHISIDDTATEYARTNHRDPNNDGLYADGDCTYAATADNEAMTYAPCPTSRSLTKSINISGVADGSHVIRARTNDVAGRDCDPSCPSATLYIDNTAPVSGGPGATAGCDLSIIDPTATFTEGGGKRWISGTISVSAQACDVTSGIDSSQIEYSINGGSWTICGSNFGMDAVGGANQSGGPDCSFSSTSGGWAENTRVNFRVSGWDKPGNGNSSAVSSNYYIDNTGNSVTFNNWEVVAPSNAGISNVTDGWTNAETMRAHFSVNMGSGSPEDNVLYQYTNGPGPAAPCVTAAEAAIATGTRSVDVANSPVACQQGNHTVRLRVRDKAGNIGTAVTPFYRYDSVVPSTPGSPAISPTEWAVGPWTLSWTNMTYNSTTQSPMHSVRLRIGNDPARFDTGCTGSGASCSLAVPRAWLPGSGGAYPIKFWFRDLAGNQDEENSEVRVAYDASDGSDPSYCPR